MNGPVSFQKFTDGQSNTAVSLKVGERDYISFYSSEWRDDNTGEVFHAVLWATIPYTYLRRII